MKLFLAFNIKVVKNAMNKNDKIEFNISKNQMGKKTNRDDTQIKIAKSSAYYKQTFRIRNETKSTF